MHVHALLPLLFAAPLALPLQDEAPTTAQDAAPETWEVVLDAFKGLRKQPIGFTGSVTREKPKQGGNNFFIGGPDFGMAAGEPFVGSYSGFRFSDDEFCVASDKRFPGFTAWQGEQLIVNTLAGKKVTDVAGTMQTIDLLLDTRKLARAADEVEWTAKPQPDGNGQVITGVLPASVIKKPKPDPRDSGMPMGIIMDFGGPNDDPLRVETTLVLDGKGALVEASYAVVHNDGNAAMQIAFEEAEGEGGVIAFEPEQEYDPVDGEVVTWSFRFAGDKPTAKIEAFRALAQELLETEDF